MVCLVIVDSLLPVVQTVTLYYIRKIIKFRDSTIHLLFLVVTFAKTFYAMPSDSLFWMTMVMLWHLLPCRVAEERQDTQKVGFDTNPKRANASLQWDSRSTSLRRCSLAGVVKMVSQLASLSLAVIAVVISRQAQVFTTPDSYNVSDKIQFKIRSIRSI